MKNHSKPTLSQTVEVMEDVDRLMQSSTTIDHEAWVDEIRQTYRSQGQEVDDQVIRNAIAEREKKMLALQMPTASAKIMLKAYLARKKIAALGSAVVLAGLLALGTNSLVDHHRLNKSEDQIQWVAASAQDWKAWMDQKAKQWSASSATPAQVAQKINGLLDQMRMLLASAPTTAPRPEDFDQSAAFYAAGQKWDEQMQAIKAQIIPLEDIAQKAQAFDAWSANRTPQRSWIAHKWGDVMEARHRAIASSNWTEMLSAQSTAQILMEADERLADTEKTLAAWPSAVQNKAQELLVAQEAAWRTGQTAQARAFVEETRIQDILLNKEYVLNIVSEPGKKSGVWRYYDGNQNAKNFYIVVAATDLAGNPVDLPILNEENKKVQTTSEFAIRVPEKVYNSVRDDKQDNGTIDNPVFGNKQRGTFDATYNYDISGGMITEW